MKTSLNRQAWVLPLLLIAVLCGVAAIRWWQLATNDEPARLTPESSRHESLVDLVLDIGTGTPRAWSVPWQPNMTVQDALAAARQQADEWTYRIAGRGAGAFLTELAGHASEGAGGRNWQFEVNGKWADRGLGVYELQPGDHLLWKFQASE